MTVLECPFCGTDVRYGLLICRGCQAHVWYHSTRNEKNRAFLTGSFAMPLLLVALYHFGKTLLAGTELERSLRLGFVAPLLVLITGILTARSTAVRHRGRPRFFR